MSVRTVIERGPKGRKAAAVAIDWPGWSRGAKTPDEAFELLEAYRERYRTVARYAGLEAEFDAAGGLDVVEDHTGPGSTDYWGISFAPSSFRRIGVHTPREVVLTPPGLRAHRAEYLAAFRERNEREWQVGRNWTLPFLLRHSAYHVLDHAWEMEDKDLS